MDGNDGKEEWQERGRAGIKTATDSQAQKTQDEVDQGRRVYTEWKKKFPGMWTPPQDTEEPYVPPRLVLATDLHYQSALGRMTEGRRSSFLWSAVTERLSSICPSFWRHFWTRS